jgi:serralysin
LIDSSRIGRVIVARSNIRCCVDRRLINAPPMADRFALLTSAQWRPKQTIRIAFRYGRRADVNAVMRAAQEWMRYCSLKIVKVLSGPAELRCTFDQTSGSWSYLGKQSLNIPDTAATMNMGWPDDFGRDLHEMGHALGLIHEHQSPAGKIPWNKPAVYRYYGGAPNFWTQEEVDQQLFARYDQATITNSEFDRKSVMLYPLPAEHLKVATFATGYNSSLSYEDKKWIGKIYP